MTLYFNDKKYKIDVKDFSDNRREIKLHKKRFYFFYYCINCVDIKLDKNYKYPFPRPSVVMTREGRIWSRHCYVSNNLDRNMDYYLKSLIDTAFEIEDIIIDQSYKSIVREQRLKKLLTN